MGSKKWWSKEHLIKFGIQNCNLMSKEASEYFNECVNAIKDVFCEIQKRLNLEDDIDKKEILEKLVKIFTFVT